MFMYHNYPINDFIIINTLSLKEGAGNGWNTNICTIRSGN